MPALNRESSSFLHYSLGDIVGLVRDNTITFDECVEILEEELCLRFPTNGNALARAYKHFRSSCQDEHGKFNAEEYCQQLCELERTLRS